MITFVPKIKTVPKIEATKENRFDSIRRIAAEKHKKSDADTARNARTPRTSAIFDDQVSHSMAKSRSRDSLACRRNADGAGPLRVGDPFQALVDKATGKAGSLPRPLIDIPSLEVEVALVPTKEDDR